MEKSYSCKDRFILYHFKEEPETQLFWSSQCWSASESPLKEGFEFRTVLMWILTGGRGEEEECLLVSLSFSRALQQQTVLVKFLHTRNQSPSGTSQRPEPACVITSLVACEVWAHRVLSLEGFQTQVQCCGSYSCTASAPELVMATRWGGFVKHPIAVHLVVRRNQPCSPLICEDVKVQGLQSGWQPSVPLPACARCFLEMA